MKFNEENTVEDFISDLLCGAHKETTNKQHGLARHNGKISGLGWKYIPKDELPRQIQEVFVEEYLSESLIRLNPDIASNPDRVDDIIYHLRAIIMGVRSDGLVNANEKFASWLNGEKSMPFGRDGEHVTIKLIDFENLENNQYILTRQFTFRSGKTEKRADIILLINGIPLIVIEAKTPVRSSESWLDGALQIHEQYEPNIPELFVPNIFSIATEGKKLHYGSIHMPVELWGPWRIEDQGSNLSLKEVGKAISSMLRPSEVLDLLANFTSYTTDKRKKRIKLIARYQQFEATNKIVERVLIGYPKKGLIWHFQGSGKSLLMLFASKKLRLHPSLKNPTLIIVVDRIDLDTQISGTFIGADTPNLVKAKDCDELKDLLNNDVRKIIITTIFKFKDVKGILNDRENIIVFVDEAHRTQEGDLGRKMRNALPNAFLFGLTGTPINRSDKNTFFAFGAIEDANGYMSRYGFDDSIRDGATKKLHFEPRLIDLHIDKKSIEKEFKELTLDLEDEEREQLIKKGANMNILMKSPNRVQAVCADIASHFQEKVAPNGFGAQVVTFDRESCILYKQELDKHLPPEVSDIVMHVKSREIEYVKYRRDRDDEEKLLDRFRDPKDPLKIIIVTSKLLTGFDAPILQTMYLDRPLRDHTLLQAICRTNRPYGVQKSFGQIIDYLGVFDNVAQAIKFDEEGINQVITNITDLKRKLPNAIQKCLTYFQGVDRSITGYEGLITAQECLPSNNIRDQFGADVSYTTRLWEAISPDQILNSYQKDYRWIVQVYESIKPTNNIGNLIWHRLGAKTTELIQQAIQVDAINDELETLMIDAELIEAILNSKDPENEGKKIEIKISNKLRKNQNNPRFKPLIERLEDLRKRHEQGILISVAFLKELLDLASDVVTAEKYLEPINKEQLGKEALTELFEEVKSEKTPIIVEKIVNDIDRIVKQVRFDDWQTTHAGEREIRKALRGTLFKYKLHSDKDLFEKAYEYIEKYY